MIETKCKNDQCEFYDTCPIRSAGEVPNDQGTDAIAYSATRRWFGSVRFLRRAERCGDIGRLWVTGPIEHSIVPPLEDVESQLPELVGLIVYIDSLGGSFRGGIALERLILLAKEKMPVVSFIQGDAASAALIPAVAADLTCGDHTAILGGFGMAFQACDGQQPCMIINEQSPEKFGVTPPRVHPTVFIESEEHRQRLQNLVNRQWDRDLSLLVAYSGVSTERLRPYLDGRMMIAREALAAGLLDEICKEGEAYKKVVRLATKRIKTHK